MTTRRLRIFAAACGSLAAIMFWLASASWGGDMEWELMYASASGYVYAWLLAWLLPLYPTIALLRKRPPRRP